MSDAFLPLVVHSGFSLMRGVTCVGELVRAAKELGYTRLALTDRDNLYALPEFLKHCAREGVDPLIGAELTEPAADETSHATIAAAAGVAGVVAAGAPRSGAPATAPSRESAQAFAHESARESARGTARDARDAREVREVRGTRVAPARVICLVETPAGYANLCRLISLRHQPAEFRAAGGLLGVLPAHAAGLTVLVDDPARLSALHERGVTVAALQPVRPQGAFVALERTARRLQVPLVAAPDSYFLRPAEHAIHQVLRAIGLNTVLSRVPAHELAPPDAWLAPPAEYVRRFAVCPTAITATQAIGERCVFRGPDRATIFPAWRDAGGRTAAAVLRAAAYAGAQRRYGIGGSDLAKDLPEAVVDRLEHELRCIEGKGFSDYFLYVQDIVRRSPRICGRGSGAASIVAYCLGITNVCPIKFNLYFERFLNPQRIDPPDIDVDFAWDERDAVQAAVLADYPGKVAMVCNHVLFQPRMAVREVGKVFGLPALEIDRVTSRLPWYWRQDDIAELTDAVPASGPPEDLQSALSQLPEMKQVRFPPPWPEILQTARRILGLPRHLSVHSGGVVITPRPVREYVPLETAAKGVPIIHWEKDGTEEMGLVKIDLLGNRSLAVIRDAIADLRRNDVPFDELHWQPEDDPATQALVARGDTMGCFYVESPATRLLQARTRKGDYEHLVIHSSIIRPAANDYIREYIRRLRGGAWEPLHPLLVDVLAESYGIMVYQEHVALTAMALADFSHFDADRLRKVLSKKDKEHELADYQRRFFDGARKKQIADDTIAAVWAMILSFSGYSFCKPHSASYARVSFQAAYLKAHHPAELLAGVLSNQGGFYSTFAYISEARRCGVTILPPDVSRSRYRYSGRDKTIRVGLLAIKHLSAASAERIIAAREERAFAGFGDFLERVKLDENEARALIHCGACDGFLRARANAAPGDRVDLLWHLAEHTARRTAAAQPAAQRRRAAAAQPALFDLAWHGEAGAGADTGAGADAPAPAVAAFSALSPGVSPAASRFASSPLPPLPAPLAPSAPSALPDAAATVTLTPAPTLTPTNPLEKLRHQFALLGFLCEHHPMLLFREELAGQKLTAARDLARHVGRRITLAGWLITGKVVSTHAGQPMEFLTFEDETGLIETTLFPREYARYCHLLNNAGPYLISGLVEEDFDVATLTIDSLALVRPKRHLAWNEHAESATTREAARGTQAAERDRSKKRA